MTDEPNLTEDQERVMIALGKAMKEGAPGLLDKELAERLEMNEDEVRRHLQALADIGFVGRDVLGRPASDPEQPESPMPPCRRCGKPADGLDHLCTRCRAIWACDHLVDDLTNALENFLDARWSPHEYDQPRPAYYLTRPNFDGDPEYHMHQIAAAQTQLAAAASRLIKLAMPAGLRTKAEPSYSPYYRPDDDPEEFGGFCAAIDWGFAGASDPEPIECRRVLRHYFVDMVQRGEAFLPGDRSPTRFPPGVLGVTEAGLQELRDIPAEDWHGWGRR
jgi:hypothetical protein